MTKKEDNVPIYYDGSSQVEFSEEITEGVQTTYDITDSNEEWRRIISGNPYGARSSNT